MGLYRVRSRVPEVVVVALVGILTALATGLGAVPVFLLGGRVAEVPARSSGGSPSGS